MAREHYKSRYPWYQYNYPFYRGVQFEEPNPPECYLWELDELIDEGCIVEDPDGHWKQDNELERRNEQNTRLEEERLSKLTPQQRLDETIAWFDANNIVWEGPTIAN